MNHPIKFLEQDNKTELVPDFFFLLFRILLREKKSELLEIYVYIVDKDFLRSF